MKVTGALLLLLAGMSICLCVCMMTKRMWWRCLYVLIVCSSHAQHICSLCGQWDFAVQSPVAVWANDRVCPARRQRFVVQRVRLLVRVRGFGDSRWRSGQVWPCLWGAVRVSKRKTFSGCGPAGAVKFMTSVTRRAGRCLDAQLSVTFPTSSTTSSPVQTNGWPAQVRLRSAGSVCHSQLEKSHYSSNARQWYHELVEIRTTKSWTLINEHNAAALFWLARVATATNDKCQAAVCECDRVASHCFAQHTYNPENKNLDPKVHCVDWTQNLSTETRVKTLFIGLNLSNKGDFWRIQCCLCLISADALNQSNWF